MKVKKNLLHESFEDPKYSNLRFKSVKTVCYYLENDPIVDAFKHIVGIFTGYNHHHQKMFTHFGLLLIATDGTQWVTERSDVCVVLGELDGKIEPPEQDVEIWDHLDIQFQDVFSFAREQSKLEYSCVTKNCKHFGYDFRRNVIKHMEHFGDYCQNIESRIN